MLSYQLKIKLAGFNLIVRFTVKASHIHQMAVVGVDIAADFTIDTKSEVWFDFRSFIDKCAVIGDPVQVVFWAVIFEYRLITLNA